MNTDPRASASRCPGAAFAARVAKAKVCVCGASSQLGRERSKLLKVEQLIDQRLRHLLHREAAVEAFDLKVRRQEHELNEQREQFRGEEADVEEKLQTLANVTKRTCQRHEALDQMERQLQQRRHELAKQRLRAQKRLERAMGTKRQLAEDRRDIVSQRTDCEAESKALREANDQEATGQVHLSDRRRQLVALGVEVDRQRLLVRERQVNLGPAQCELQAKEADLNERQSLLDRRDAAVQEREAGLDSATSDGVQLSQRTSAVQQGNEESERQLGLLWDDIHQRQQVLEDIGTSLHGREERLRDEEHALICDGDAAWGAWPAPEQEQLELELMAAELADRAWRERSAALLRREEELSTQLGDLEAELVTSGSEKLLHETQQSKLKAESFLHGVAPCAESAN